MNAMGRRTSARSGAPSQLGRPYRDLSDGALLDRLAADRRTDILEAFWRYGDPQLCAALVEPVLRAGLAPLIRLFVDEVLEPTVSGPFPRGLIEALRQHRPLLPDELTGRLAERLRDPTALPHPQFEQDRALLEIWVLGQSSDVGESFAIAVVEGQTPRAHDGAVRGAAYERCIRSPGSLVKAAKVVVAQLESSPSQDVWARGAELVERACGKQRLPVDALRPLVERLVALAPQLASGEEFGPGLCRLIGGPLLQCLRGALENSLPDSPGGRALIRAIRHASNPRRRAQVFAAALAAQDHMWSVLQPLVQAWGDEDWSNGLRVLATGSSIAGHVASWLLNASPISQISNMIDFTMAQAEDEEHPILAEAGARLSRRLQELAVEPSSDQAMLGCINWRLACRGQNIRKLKRVLAAVEPGLALSLVIAALRAARIRPRHGALLIPDGREADALRALDPPLRGQLAAALCHECPERAPAAITQIQTEEFTVDVARPVAPVLGPAAFAGAAEAWAGLTDSDRDSLVELLRTHATTEELSILEVIVRDDHKDNRDRRRAATSKIADLLEGTGGLPACVTDLLRSNIRELRQEAVRAIGKVKPRDGHLIKQVHDVVQGGGEPGRAAVEALDSLVAGWLQELAVSSTKDQVRELLPLLGATGRPQVLPCLRRYLGASAEYDDPVLRREAARAIAEIAEHLDSVSESEQAALVALIDGDDRETDPEARDSLAKALSRFQLGEDQALAVLFELAGWRPQGDPSSLFGSEREPLVRQLALYAREKERGEPGRGTALTHLDNVAERLVRAAYLACPGGSGAIKSQIAADPRKPDYGNLITALSSVRELQSIRDDCGKLHDIRSRLTEVPHPGQPPGDETWITAHHCFKEIATACLRVLSRRGGSSRG